MGLIRDNTDSYFAGLTEMEIKNKLKSLNEEYDPACTESELRDKLIKISRQRHLKIWHDHSEISGHSHFLVLVSAVYDPAFYLTPTELDNKGISLDIQTVVEEPEIHILARSASSLQDQQMFSECRKECINKLDQDLHTQQGTPVHDVVRFFHGDSPAQQLEAGNKVGGHYPCVACDAKSSCFDDFAYCFRANCVTLEDRQQFILKGESWKRKNINPLSDLNVANLRSELQARGISTTGKKRVELDKELAQLQKGTSNVPALLQTTPEATLESCNLSYYEVLPTEPLHDLKGHLSVIIPAAASIAKNETCYDQ